MASAHVDVVQLRTEDSQRLEATWFRPQESLPRAAVCIHSATAVKKEFYSNFARYLAGNGYAVLTFDYRGVGGSRPASLRGFEANMRDWGIYDMPAALAHVAQTYPGLPRFILGHSMGGQLVGLMHNHHLADGIILTAASTAYWEHLPMPYGLYTALIWYGLVPLTTSLFGYFAIHRLGLGEDLPSGVAKEWARWCTTPNYLRAHVGTTIASSYYDQIRCPIKAYVLEGDRIATERTAPDLLRYFENATVEFEVLKSLPQGVPGHFGLFSRRFAEQWTRPLGWLNQRVTSLAKP